ncbi:hypothetical protein NKI77_07725 [Mesorhizobium opportunistum]|uniref:Uncharacterized protein n=1 Tax=Mesorhizobium opportunistum TaxID=593909 RepID=A0ABV1YBM8_9HYPH|nr:hypothetical protein [Mesorhizobium sp.]
MVRLLVEEARHALLEPNDAQRERDDRFIDLYLNRGRPSRAAGSFFGPLPAIHAPADSQSEPVLLTSKTQRPALHVRLLCFESRINASLV